MKKKINLTDIFLFIAAGIVDLYQEIKDPLNLFSHYYQTFYGKIPSRWKKNHLRSLFKYCLKKKYLTKKSDFNLSKFFLSKKGTERLMLNYPSIFYKPEDWDNKIRMVIYDVKELNRSKRNLLRKFLKKLGYIMLQKSVWVSPFNQFKILKRWLKNHKLEERILLLETQQVNIKNKNSIISKFWKLKF